MTSIATHRAIQAVDPAALCDDEVGPHLMWCADHHAAMILLHISMSGSASVMTMHTSPKWGSERPSRPPSSWC